jgi:hypothetical protein
VRSVVVVARKEARSAFFFTGQFAPQEFANFYISNFF